MHFDRSRVRTSLAALLCLFFLAALYAPQAFAQRPPAQPNAAEILHKMQKLQVVGSVLYIVAHPDDENTKLISWLANGKKVRTGNLSLTRGDGGQNLIGPELGDALGIIRTQELMEARRIDGGEQFFTRAVDFGYSKSADESFDKWGKQEVLSDVVRVIRMFRPDIIITRFSHVPGGTHGHHTASAILAHEAFDLAADPKAFPEQLEEGLEVWQARRLFFNGSTWWRKDLEDVAKNDPDWFSVDVGGYDPLLGLSYTEIAGRSRSMHKSQGFGAAETRGKQLEFLHFEKGDRPKGDDIFEGLDMTWGRVKGGAEFAQRIQALQRAFDPKNPGASAGLVEALSVELKKSAFDKHLVTYLTRELDLMLQHVSATSVEVLGDSPTYPTGSPIELSMDALVRQSVAITVAGTGTPDGDGWFAGINLEEGRPNSQSIGFVAKWTVDEPFWLSLQRKGSMYTIDPPALIGAPDRNTILTPTLAISNARGAASLPIQAQYKWVDRVDGERVRPVYVTPVASIIPKTDILIARGGTQTVEIEVEALTDSLSGQLNVTLPEGWGTTKDLKLVNIAKRGDRQSFTFQLIPGANAKDGAVKFEFSGPKGKADRRMHEIDYPHIMPQVYYTPAEVKLIPLDVKVNAERVGYIKGAGDDVPQAIERLGVSVDMVDPSTATLESLSKYDAIVVGIRAYNTERAMAQFNPVLMKYVENGGTVVAQYNTLSSDMMVPSNKMGPYPFELSRGRITVEEAPPTFLLPKHPLLNTPNKITLADFDGWVQERGLYFVGERDPKYSALISWNDPGEEPLDGALIVADHGKGRYIYTGISFFRELPAGVAGAYRLWANLISKREEVKR